MNGVQSRETGGAHHRAGIFLLSMATLLLELSWTRVLSVSLWERLTQAIPFDPFSLLVATPFFFSGLTITLLFTRIA